MLEFEEATHGNTQGTLFHVTYLVLFRIDMHLTLCRSIYGPMNVFSYIFNADQQATSLTVKEVGLLADDVSPDVARFAQEKTSLGDLKAIKLYRRETGCSLAVAMRVLKELQWRASLRS